MSTIDFSRPQTAQIVAQIQTYFDEKLDQQIGSFDAEFLLDFFKLEIGGHFYNQALSDVHTMLSQQMDSMSDSLIELEKMTPNLK